MVRYLGRAGDGKAWHHVVEQSQANVRRFGAETIHNTANVIALPDKAGELHRRISGIHAVLHFGCECAFYSSKQWFSEGHKVRMWLSQKSFQEQFEFGMKHLKRIAKEISP